MLVGKDHLSCRITGKEAAPLFHRTSHIHSAYPQQQITKQAEGKLYLLSICQASDHKSLRVSLPASLLCVLLKRKTESFPPSVSELVS